MIVLTKEEVLELLNSVKDPFLHKTLEETNGISEVRMIEDKKHVSVKIAIGKPNTAEQMELQQELVGILRKMVRKQLVFVLKNYRQKQSRNFNQLVNNRQVRYSVVELTLTLLRSLVVRVA